VFTLEVSWRSHHPPKESALSDHTADRPYLDRVPPVVSAAHDQTGTIRRSITNWGFAHFIKLSQPEGQPCWLCYDCYGPTDGILPDSSFLTDAQIDANADTEVVYVPMDDRTWARIHGLNPDPDPSRPEEIV
jgi:hypothetical protein